MSAFDLRRFSSGLFMQLPFPFQRISKRGEAPNETNSLCCLLYEAFSPFSERSGGRVLVRGQYLPEEVSILLLLDNPVHSFFVIGNGGEHSDTGLL